MNTWSWSLIGIICVCVYYYFKKHLDYFKDFGIPCTRGWPLLGFLGEVLFRRKHFFAIIEDAYNAYPDAKYTGIFDMKQPVIMLRDLELIKTIAIKNFDSFHDRKAVVDVNIDPLFGGNLFSMPGDQWKEARNLLSPAFTSSKMKGMFPLMVDCAKNFVNYIDEQPEDDNKNVGTKDLFTKYTNDVIATCAFGISIDSLKNPNNDFYVLGGEATNFDKFNILKIIIIELCPKLCKLFNMKLVSDRVTKFFMDIVETTVKTRDEKGIVRPDMLQLMMDARDKDSKHLKLDTLEMTAQAFVFFFGGFETTSTQMCIIAHELAINPDIQKRLQDEIDEVMKISDGKPSYEQINDMVYLDAVFNESLRLHTQFGVLNRKCIEAFKLPAALPGGKPFTIPPGMNVWIPAAAIHRDSKYYNNPNKFDPERYYHKKVTINDVTNLAFGIGPRSCIGNRFAILEIKILFVYLLSKFNLKANAKTCSPFKYERKFGFTLKPEGGFWLSIEPRR